VWENSATSAQYYVNPAGTSVADACVWGEAGSNTGNWAPVNLGVGKATTGETFISMFPNSPTNTYGKLNFNIEIDGGVSGKCTYEDGTFYQNGVASVTGCTVSDNNLKLWVVLIMSRSRFPAKQLSRSYQVLRHRFNARAPK
jgi:hypothetical protein